MPEPSHTFRQQCLGYAFAALAALFWAFLGPLGRICMADGLSPQETAFWRALFGAFFFWLHAAPKGAVRVPPRIALTFAAFGCVGVSGFFGAYFLAVEEAGAALAAVLLYTAPAWVALLSRLFFREAFTGPKLLALGLALSGAALACLSGGGLPQGASALGIAAGLTAGFCYSLHYIFGAHYLKQYSPLSLYCWCLPAGALLLLPFISFSAKSSTVWITLVMLGFFCTYAAYRSYCEGLKRLPPTVVAVVATLEPLLAALAAWWLWGEMLSLQGWTGAGLILGGVLLTVLFPASRAGSTARPVPSPEDSAPACPDPLPQNRRPGP
jgi:drug/metabolite transporter (DMT)-like permease